MKVLDEKKKLTVYNFRTIFVFQGKLIYRDKAGMIVKLRLGGSVAMLTNNSHDFLL